MRTYNAFILAGGLCPWLKALRDTDCRALALINGKYMLSYIIEALQQSGRVNKIVVAISPDAIAEAQRVLPQDVIICAAEGDMPTTAYAAAQALKADANEMLLSVCDDIPLLTAEAIQSFLAQCESEGYAGADVYYPIIPQLECLKLYPEAKRTYGKLTDGSFTGGNIMLLNNAVITQKQQLGKEIFALRKSPLKLASWLGWSFIFKAVFHLLSVKATEQRVSEILDAKCRAIITPHAAIGMDVDKPADLELIEKYLSK